MRLETDSIGQLEVNEASLFGIHSLRAKLNFPDTDRFSIEWYQAISGVKLAYYICYEKFTQAVNTKFPNGSSPLKFIDPATIASLIDTASRMSEGEHFEHFIVPAIQGGAGTSINMNINEIIANASLINLGKSPGNYDVIHPIEHANIYQSTNDVVPTGLRIALMRLLDKLERKINDTRAYFEELEKKHLSTLRIAYTQMQSAVPTTFGKLFSAYAEALSRDWWRVSKCFERIKVVNIGGSAAGTGLTVPRYFIMEVPNILKTLTDLPVTRSENLTDATSNQDTLVEVHAILKAHAVNLEKISGDLRLLASDIGESSIKLPSVQTGSSIMPGKINPVINEYVIEVSHIVYSHDQLITGLTAAGCLDLNAYLPVIGHYLIKSIKMLIAANDTLCKNLLESIDVDKVTSDQKVIESPSVTTALLPYIGYKKAEQLAKLMQDEKINIYEANKKLKIMSESILSKLIQSDSLNKLGFSVNELITDK